MPFIADPTNVATPADSDQARNAAAEMRAIKQRITTENAAQDAAIGTAQTTANTAVANAAAAQSTANTAVANAATAQGTANTALTNAATAQSTANDALATASALGFSSVQLTGSGLWNVPVGVTEVIAFMQGGGTASYSATGTKYFPYASVYVRCVPLVGDVKVLRLSVTGGSQLAYAVGVGQILASTAPSYAQSHDLEQQLATPTALAGNSAGAAITRRSVAVGSNVDAFQQTLAANGGMGAVSIGGGGPDGLFDISTSNYNVAGDAGSLILLYR